MGFIKFTRNRGRYLILRNQTKERELISAFPNFPKFKQLKTTIEVTLDNLNNKIENLEKNEDDKIEVTEEEI